MQQGFFNHEELGPTPQLGTLRKCGACGLHKGVASPKMKPGGKGKKGILTLCEAPGREEDLRGTQLVGSTGRMYAQALREFGFKLHTDFRKINAVNCRPPKNRTPTPIEIDCCRPMVLKEIARFKPKLILVHGSAACRSLFGHRYKSKAGVGGIGRWRGFCIPDRDLNSWVCPMYHPSFVERSSTKEGNAAAVIFMDDLGRALRHYDKPFPRYRDERDYVDHLTDPGDIRAFLRDVRKLFRVAVVDFETTGLKPERRGHRILTCAIAVSKRYAVAFPVLDEIKQDLRAFLTDERIYKVAHNIKYETRWAEAILGIRIRPWLMCTMLGAHVLDNREGITSLDFQTFVNFGVVDYDSHLSSFKNGIEPKNANSLNRLDEVPLHDLLTYNGLDVIYTFWLFLRQRRKLIGSL